MGVIAYVIFVLVCISGDCAEMAFQYNVKSECVINYVALERRGDWFVEKQNDQNVTWYVSKCTEVRLIRYRDS